MYIRCRNSQAIQPSQPRTPQRPTCATAARRPIVAMIPLVPVAERPWLLASVEIEDRPGDVAGLLHRRWREHGDLLAVLLEGREIADHPEALAALDAAVRADHDAAGAAAGQVEELGERGRADAGRPDDRVGLEDLAVAQAQPTRLAALDAHAETEVDVPALELLRRVLAKVVPEHRERLLQPLDEDDMDLAHVELGKSL
jgi:hypothetical protein